MVVLGADDSVQLITDEARALLDEMNIDAGTGLELPSVVYQAAHVARSQAPVLVAPTRVWLPSGRWLLVHASRLTDANRRTDAMAVMLQPARRSQLVALIVELYGLTRKECRVTELLVRGLGIEEIAQTLSISRHTVRDHVKVIFAKMGVTSRPELTAKLVHEHIA